MEENRKSLWSIANEYKLDIDDTAKIYQYQIKKLKNREYKKALNSNSNIVDNRMNEISDYTIEIIDRYYKIKNSSKLF